MPRNVPGRLQPLSERILARLPSPRCPWILLWASVPWLNAGANLLLDTGARSAVWEQSRLLVVLSYAALSFAAPGKVRYRYRLEGLEPDWIEAGGTRAVSYNHLPPGDYRFRVTACNNDGIWGESGATVAFTVMPSFWQTSWFLSIAIFGGASLVGGTVWLVDKTRTRRKLERLEQERALEHERARVALRGWSGRKMARTNSSR